uniref:Capsid protein n=1 Tax=Cressdnaviricota sp. TaxID=2748378 RepID=A0A6M3YNX7_9VIRU|nr:MAG: capsid protein [Cressdnaviricota sp.]
MYGKSYKNRRTIRGRTYRAMYGKSYKNRRTIRGRTYRARTVSRSLKRETKFMDDYLNLNHWRQHTQTGSGQSTGFTNWVLGGVVLKETLGILWGTAGGSTTEVKAPRDIAVANCLSNISTGTTANTRIGNLIEPRYITVKGVVTAGVTTQESDPETTDKVDPDGTTVSPRYCRTSMKVMIVRDKSMNEQGFVDFTDMFETPSGGIGTNTNAYLWNRKIDTIGRYEILKQVEFNLDQDDPQKCFTWTIGLGGKQIRYNGASNGKYTELGNYTKPRPSLNGVDTGWRNNWTRTDQFWCKIE